MMRIGAAIDPCGVKRHVDGAIGVPVSGRLAIEIDRSLAVNNPYVQIVVLTVQR